MARGRNPARCGAGGQFVYRAVAEREGCPPYAYPTNAEIAEALRAEFGGKATARSVGVYRTWFRTWRAEFGEGPPIVSHDAIKAARREVVAEHVREIEDAAAEHIAKAVRAALREIADATP